MADSRARGRPSADRGEGRNDPETPEISKTPGRCWHGHCFARCMTQALADLVVVGSGASGRRFLECGLARGLTQSYRIRVFDEHASARRAQSCGPVIVERETVIAVDPNRQVLETASGQQVRFDTLVLATGAQPLPSASRLPLGCFAFRGPADLS